MVSLTQAAAGGGDVFEGPEKTLTLCFKKRKVAAGSLRVVPQDTWSQVLKHARCEILSSVESTPVSLSLSKNGKEKKASTKGLTGYLLSESSLFLSDTTLSLKTCGRTTPLQALEPILDIVVPNWRKKCSDEYLTYVCFSRLGYMFPEDQPEPHSSWAQEVAYLEKFFRGEDVVAGSKADGCAHHVYVANYLPQGEIQDAFSTQVALTGLDPTEAMAKFSEHSTGPEAPLKAAWKHLHGDEPRSIAANYQLDERFFDPQGYSANGLFGRHFTTVHATPQPSCSYVSVETTMPMTREARQRFVQGAAGMCRASALTLTEFALCPALFARAEAPEVPGFKLRRSSQSIGGNFACSLHHFTRELPNFAMAQGLCLSAPAASWSLAPRPPAQAAAAPEASSTVRVPLFKVTEVALAAVQAAQLFLRAPEGQDCGLAKDAPVALLDLGALRRRAEAWRQHLPRVEPFYAVKCNSHPALVGALWQLWQEWGYGGFDCASPAEMETVTRIGVDPADRVVYANPCKQESAISFAKSIGVRCVVFDNEAELLKLQRLHPTAKLLLRVQTDDSLAQCPLSNKFGARMEDAGALLARARELGLSVVGVSFHVGSGCSQRGAFRSALQRARAVFDEEERCGFMPTLLDIGGGFPGWDEAGQVSFAEHAADITELLEELFPSRAVRVIAEPGRFFAATAQAALTMVVSTADTTQGHRYYLNDGLYGSFNCLLYDHAVAPQPTVLRSGKVLSPDEAGPNVRCTVFGPTCDGFDVVADSMDLPRLQVGDRLLFPNMGAYTSAASTSFNGFAPAAGFVYESQLAAANEGGP